MRTSIRIDPTARAATAAIVLLLLAGGAQAQAPKWNRKVAEIEAALHRRDWEGAREASAVTIKDLIRRAPFEPTTLDLGARILVFQAIAEANLGAISDAVWHWQAAANFLGDLEALDLSAFGVAEEVLTETSTSPRGGRPPSSDEAADYRQVQVLKSVKPELPRKVRDLYPSGFVEVAIEVDLEGRARNPEVTNVGAVDAMVLPALEALKDWRFLPASRNEERIRVRYELRIRYM
jgi:hypothetical protein